MKLANLEKSLLTCIAYHKRQGNNVKVAQIEKKLQEVKDKELSDEVKFNLYK